MNKGNRTGSDPNFDLFEGPRGWCVCSKCGDRHRVLKATKKLTKLQVKAALDRVLAKFPPYAIGNTASLLAAIGQMPKAPHLRIRVLLYLTSIYPESAHDTEASDAMSMYRYTYAPRRVELRDVGLVVDVGTRLNGKKFPETVWRATEEAVRWVTEAVAG